jgi:hypothetical protein
MFFNIDGGCSRNSVSARQGPHRRCFLVLMVGAPGSPAPPPPKRAAVDDFYVDDVCSRIFVSTFQGAHHRRFLALMMGAPGSPSAPVRCLPSTFLCVDGGAPGSPALSPKGPATNVLQLTGSRSQTSGNASHGATMSRTFLSKKFQDNRAGR